MTIERREHPAFSRGKNTQPRESLPHLRLICLWRMHVLTCFYHHIVAEKINTY